MRTVIKTIDDCAETIQLNCTPMEWLIINKALRQFVAIDEIRKLNHPNDVSKAESMLAVEPVIKEVGNEADFRKEMKK